MGEKIAAKRVWASVNGLNEMFNKANLPATRAYVKFLREGADAPYKNFLKKGNKRIGSLWFAASVLTAHFDDYTLFPGDSQRRWIKWLMWLQKEHQTTHDKIIDVINFALKSGSANAQIVWNWTEGKDFKDDEITDISVNPPPPWNITVQSVSARVSDIDKKVAEDE